MLFVGGGVALYECVSVCELALAQTSCMCGVCEKHETWQVRRRWLDLEKGPATSSLGGRRGGGGVSVSPL